MKETWIRMSTIIILSKSGFWGWGIAVTPYFAHSDFKTSILLVNFSFKVSNHKEISARTEALWGFPYGSLTWAQNYFKLYWQTKRQFRPFPREINSGIFVFTIRKKVVIKFRPIFAQHFSLFAYCIVLVCRDSGRSMQRVCSNEFRYDTKSET